MNVIQILSSQPWAERLGWVLIHFLWQGALIGAIYGAARYVVRRSKPQARYAIACMALAAMACCPIATWNYLSAANHLATSAGENLALANAASASPSARFSFPALSATNSPEARSILGWVVLVWFAGTICLWTRLIGGWIVTLGLRSRMVESAPLEWQESLHCLALRVRVSRPVGMLVSAVTQTPAVIGWLRPVILIPAGALINLPADQMEALLLHELAHIRRADYLVGILQSFVEAMLFYHPAVWWVSGQIRAERELCCDDIAAEEIGDVVTYARALSAMEGMRMSPASAAMAASGGSLVHRISRLLGRPVAAPRSWPGPTAMAVFLGVTVLGIFAQTSERPKFEVASIKPSPEQRFMAVRPLSGGRLSATAPVRLLVINAYGLAPYQVAGGPAWIDSDRYLIDAKAADNPGRAELMLMLQSLLEDRFQLKSHRETRQLPVYALVAGKGGPRLPPPKDTGCVDADSDRGSAPGQPVTVPCGHVKIAMSSAGVQMLGAAVPMSELVKMLSGALGRSVIDQTGFTGKFDLHLEFTPDMAAAGLPASAVPAPDPSGAAPPAEMTNPSIFSAIQEQLGLKLESTKGPVEVLVIDRVERPSAN